jgi:hypothetical protein
MHSGVFAVLTTIGFDLESSVNFTTHESTLSTDGVTQREMNGAGVEAFKRSKPMSSRRPLSSCGWTIADK